MDSHEFDDSLVNLASRLYNFALSLTSNRDDAQDLLQETVLKALTHRGKFENDSNLQAWTFTIMRNTFINNFRRQKKQASSLDGIENKHLVNSFVSLQESPESIYSFSVINDKVLALDVTFRIPFQMHLIGYKYEEIAEGLGLKVGTVKSRIFFCRKKLMNELPEYAKEWMLKRRKKGPGKGKDKDKDKGGSTDK